MAGEYTQVSLDILETVAMGKISEGISTGSKAYRLETAGSLVYVSYLL